MRHHRHWKAIAILLGTLTPGMASAQGAAAADTYPFRPVTIVLGVAAGASNDIETRLYAQKLGDNLRQPFLVDYKPGAGQTIAAAYVAKSAPDGYTLLNITPSFTLTPALYRDLPYDPVKDFVAVSLASKMPYLLLVTPALPARTVAELVALSKAKPGELNFGTAGAGGFPHVAGVWLQTLTGTRLTFVHYKGGAPSYTALMAGEVQIGFGGLAAVAPLVRAGKMRAIASTGSERSRLYPDLPTVAEQGVPGYEASTWLAYVIPVKTPVAIVNKLNAEFAKVARDADVVQKLMQAGADPVGGSPEQLRQLIAAEALRWRKLVQDTGMKLEE